MVFVGLVSGGLAAPTTALSRPANDALAGTAAGDGDSGEASVSPRYRRSGSV
jgi:hypothetical protein